MEKFLNEALRTGEGISLSDALATGGRVTGLGLAIVFGVLVILMIVLYLFKVIFYKDDSKNAKTVTDNSATQNNANFNQPDDTELIAVITAAIACHLGTSASGLRIKSYRRIDNKKPVWYKAGISDSINNRF